MPSHSEFRPNPDRTPATLVSLIGDATEPVGTGPRIVAHICNDVGGWGRGFVVAVSRHWPAAERAYRQWAHGHGDVPFALGQVQVVPVAPELWVANMLAQHGLGGRGTTPIRYGALQEALGRVATFALSHQASVHMPRIGTGLAGGSWATITGLIETELVHRGVAVTVYTLHGPVSR